jgi:hypothetical protein
MKPITRDSYLLTSAHWLMSWRHAQADSSRHRFPAAAYGILLISLVWKQTDCISRGVNHEVDVVVAAHTTECGEDQSVIQKPGTHRVTWEISVWAVAFRGYNGLTECCLCGCYIALPLSSRVLSQVAALCYLIYVQDVYKREVIPLSIASQLHANRLGD